jgi:Fe-S-cluster containining protein
LITPNGRPLRGAAAPLAAPDQTGFERQDRPLLARRKSRPRLPAENENDTLTGATPSTHSLSLLCQSCGACCSFSREWPRFSTEDSDALDRIPAALVDDSLGRMRCIGDRCAALAGDIGVSTSCTIYQDRPDVCRACIAGDDACQMARLRYGMPLV